MFVYFLSDCNRKSYIGFSTDVQRRVKEHKKKLKRSAKYTKKFSQCRLEAYISGVSSKRSALSLEWYCKRKWKKAKPLPNMPHKRLSTFFHALTVGKHAGHKDIVIHVRTEEMRASVLTLFGDKYCIELIDASKFLI